MNKTLGVTKYLFYDLRNAMKYYYVSIGAITLLMVGGFLFIANKSATNTRFSGFGASAIIFLFILGLNFFKANFKFMQANNVSRRRLYLGIIMAILAGAAMMAAIEVLLNNGLELIIPYRGIVEDIYKTNSFIADFIWSFSIYSLATSIGWLIGMVYYRLDKMLKTVVSITAVFFIIILTVIDNLIEFSVSNFISSFFIRLFGLGTLNPYIASANFIMVTLVIMLLCFPLIRRMPLKA